MSLLQKYTYNISAQLENALAADYVFKHQDIINKIFVVLSRKYVRNPVLVSNDKAQKIEIVLEFAKALLLNQLPVNLKNPEHFQNREILLLNHLALTTIEDNEAYHLVLNQLTDELLEKKDSVFFYIEDGHTLIGNCITCERYNSKFWLAIRHWQLQVIWGSNQNDYRNCIEHHNAHLTAMRSRILL